MTVWTLVLFACLAGRCQSFELPVEGCGLGGQAALIEWREENPGWEVRRWSCLPGRPA
jgi:hypothetical protein